MAYLTQQESDYARALGISEEEAVHRIARQNEILAETYPIIARRLPATTAAEHEADRKAGAKVLAKARAAINRRIVAKNRWAETKSERDYGAALGISTTEAAALCEKHRKILASSPAVIYRRLAA